LEIHCGPKGIEKAELDATCYLKYSDKPSLWLPRSDEYKNYWWDVKDLTIVLNWGCENVERQIDFANYLTNVCRAHQVFTLLNGDIVKFQHERILKAA